MTTSELIKQFKDNNENYIVLNDPLPVKSKIEYESFTDSHYKCHYYNDSELYIEYFPRFENNTTFINHFRISTEEENINLIINRHIILPSGKIYKIVYESFFQKHMTKHIIEHNKIKKFYINDNNEVYILHQNFN